VTGTVFYGHDALVQLELSGSGSPVRLTARTLDPFTVVPAATVWLRVVGDVLFYPVRPAEPANPAVAADA
jgi:hypothetical protein